MNRFTDAAALSTWAQAEVGGMAAAGYVQGHNGLLRPQDPITRAEVMVVIDRLIDIFINKPGIYSGSGRIAVVKTPDAVLDGAEIRDIFVTEGVGTGEFTLRNTKVTGTIYVNGGSLVTIAAGATVNKIEVSGNNVEVVVNGKVDTITVNASNVSISGEGDLATVFVESGTGNSVTVSGANVIVAEGAGQVDRSNGDIEQREEDREESAPVPPSQDGP